MAHRRLGLLRGVLLFASTTTFVLIYYWRVRSASRPKVVLLWTTWCGRRSYPYFVEDVIDRKCPQECIFTSRRDQLQSSDAVLFHGKDIQLDDMPTYRNSRQRWIFFSLEPPVATPAEMLRAMNGMFNLTMTYRRDSDVTTLYGYTFRRRQRPLKPKSTSGKGTSSPRFPKPGVAVWMVSHCKTSSRREAFVAELQKVIPVDVFGKCGVHDCQPKASDTCYKSAAKNYSFYLSFENSICKDYVTEKFFRPLLFDIVPVVMGGGNYPYISPPGSYIDALQFGSPVELGHFLKRVAADVDWYESYSLWKQYFEIKYEGLACKLCTKLHLDFASGRTFTYNRFREWFLDDAHCTDWEQVMSSLRSERRRPN